MIDDDNDDVHAHLVAEEYRVRPRRGDDGQPDPLRAAFDNYCRAPRDIVRREPVIDNKVAELAGQTVELTHHKMTKKGITARTERLVITAPITWKDNEE